LSSSVPESDEINRRLATLLREAGIPVILIDRDFVSDPFRSDFDLAGSILSPFLALHRVSMRASLVCLKLS
jgi:hypothetical protein